MRTLLDTSCHQLQSRLETESTCVSYEQIGVSNYEVADLTELLSIARIPPAVNQVSPVHKLQACSTAELPSVLIVARRFGTTPTTPSPRCPCSNSPRPTASSSRPTLLSRLSLACPAERPCRSLKRLRLGSGRKLDRRSWTGASSALFY